MEHTRLFRDTSVICITCDTMALSCDTCDWAFCKSLMRCVAIVPKHRLRCNSRIIRNYVHNCILDRRKTHSTVINSTGPLLHAAHCDSGLSKMCESTSSLRLIYIISLTSNTNVTPLVNYILWCLGSCCYSITFLCNSATLLRGKRDMITSSLRVYNPSANRPFNIVAIFCKSRANTVKSHVARESLLYHLRLC